MYEILTPFVYSFLSLSLPFLPSHCSSSGISSLVDRGTIPVRRWRSSVAHQVKDNPALGSQQPLQHLKDMEMRHSGTWFRGGLYRIYDCTYWSEGSFSNLNNFMILLLGSYYSFEVAWRHSLHKTVLNLIFLWCGWVIRVQPNPMLLKGVVILKKNNIYQ